MKKKLISLIDLKSIITMLLVISLVVVVFNGISIEDEAIKAVFISTTSSCFTYYFAKRGAKEKQSEVEDRA